MRRNRGLVWSVPAYDQVKAAFASLGVGLPTIGGGGSETQFLPEALPDLRGDIGRAQGLLGGWSVDVAPLGECMMHQPEAPVVFADALGPRAG